MSNIYLNEDNRQIVITPEDCESAINFWTHFGIPLPPALLNAAKAFSTSQTFENQELFKLQICKAITESNNNAFSDEMFSKIVEECHNAAFEIEFDKDLEKILTKK